MRITRRRGRIGFAALALFMFLAPLVFDAARQTSFSASKVIRPRAAGPYPAREDPAYYTALVQDSALQQYMRTVTGARTSVVTGAQFRYRFPGTIVMTVTAETPQRAHSYAEALARQIVVSSRREFAAEAQKDADQLSAVAEGPVTVGRGERRALQRQLAAKLRLRDHPLARAEVDPTPATYPQVTRLPDRLANALPGRFPPRSNPLWAGLAGLLFLLLARALYTLVLRPPSEDRHLPPL